MTGEFNVAELLIKQLQIYNVKRIYGVVGDGIIGMMDALANQKEIKFIAVKHESVAAMMASAEAKLTGNIGVCAATMGPGLGNLMNGLGDAYMDKAPVLVITGQAPTYKIGTDYKQYVNQQELIKPFADYSTLLAHQDSIVSLATKAMDRSLSKGVVSHLSIPKDLFTMPSLAQVKQKPTVIKGTYNVQTTELERAVALLNTAKQPIILAGLGSKHAASEVNQLAKVWGAGILYSLGAKGVFSEDSDYVIGGIGQGGNPYAKDLFPKADVVLVVGDTWWPEGYVPQQAQVIQIDIEEENIGKGVPANIGIVGDVKQVLPSLLGTIVKQSDIDAWKQQWQQTKQQWSEQNNQEGKQPGSPIPPSTIVRALEETVDQQAILSIDTGDVTVWMNRNYRAKQEMFVFSGDWRTMGFGLPGAMAAKLCYPERQVLAIVGDGGIEMTLADLLTAVRYNLDIIVIVFNNESLQMEKDKMIVGGYEPEGVSLTNPDFVQVANACGWQGIRIENDTELKTQLNQALKTKGPILVDIYTAPMVHPETKS